MCYSVSGVVLRGSGDVRGCQSLIAYCRPLSERFGSATVNFSTTSLPLCDNPLNHIGNVSSWHKTHHRGFTVDPSHLSKQFHAKEEENAIHPDTRQRLARMKWRRTSPQGSRAQPGNEPHRGTDLPISDGRLWAKHHDATSSRRLMNSRAPSTRRNSETWPPSRASIPPAHARQPYIRSLAIAQWQPRQC